MSEEDIVVLSTVTVSKIILADGTVSLQIEEGEDQVPWDSIGMLQVAMDLLRDEAMYLMDSYIHVQPEEDDDY